VEVQATTSRSFATNSGSVETFKVRTRCGLRPWATQMRRTISGETPAWAPIDRVDQCVASGGAVFWFSDTIQSTSSAVISRGRPERGASWASASVPPSAKRVRHRITVVRVIPRSLAICRLETPVAAIPLAAGAFTWAGLTLAPAVGAILMSVSTIVVAANAQLLRRLRLGSGRA
jgi:hypothetical protein